MSSLPITKTPSGVEHPDGAHYHFDTPCTIENQIKMFKEAGFATAEKAWRVENTTIIVAKK